MKIVHERRDQFATKLVAFAAHQSFVLGESQAVLQLIEEHPDDRVCRTACPHLMTYGRLDALPALKDATQKGDPALTKAALEAPRRMSDATPEEKVAVCPWLDGFLGDADLATAAEAGRGMIWYGGERVDSLLAEGEEARGRGTVPRLPRALLHLHERHGQGGSRGRATPPRCGIGSCAFSFRPARV